MVRGTVGQWPISVRLLVKPNESPAILTAWLDTWRQTRSKSLLRLVQIIISIPRFGDLIKFGMELHGQWPKIKCVSFYGAQYPLLWTSQSAARSPCPCALIDLVKFGKEFMSSSMRSDVSGY